ncbi:MAG: AMP-binding protein, partial [bacterium]|nr:AMP-binding protein [bacterium]
LVFKLGLEFDPLDFPLFDVAVLLTNIHDKKYFHPIEPNILFSFVRNDRSVEMELEYNTLLYRESTIRQIINHFSQLLSAAIFNPAVPSADIEVLSPREKKQLLEDFNDNSARFPADKYLIHFLEKQAELDPEKPAFEYNDEQLTYGDLNRQANQVAHLLREQGIQPGKFVGILLNRTPAMATNILATWKAGGAYIPI